MDYDLTEGGGLAPYHPTTPLPTTTADQPDYLVDRGQPQPAGQGVALVESFGRSMAQAGVPNALVVAAGKWFDSAAGGKGLDEPRAHSFDLRAYGLHGDAYAHSFANAMERAGAGAGDVQKMLDWYKTWERGQTASHDIDAQDRINAETVLRGVWGQSYLGNLRLINKYLDGLPAVERDEIESSTLPSGGLYLNDPDALEYLLKKASSGPSPLSAEIAAAEARMRTDRKRWFRDDAAQARLRELYRIRDGK